MDIEYRKLSEKELDLFIEMRIKQLREEGAKEDFDLKPALRDYYVRHMKDGTFVSWVAVKDDRIIGTSGMSFVEKTAIFRMPQRKDRALIQHVYEPGLQENGNCKRTFT